MTITRLLTSLLCAIILSALPSCGDKAKSPSEADSPGTAKPSASEFEDVVVDTITAKAQPFSVDVISNGRARARDYADIYFRSPEIISEVLVKNGQRVRAGQPLARLDLFKLNNDKVKGEAAVRQAELDMQDVLIGQGYDPENLGAVPRETIKLARTRSGLDQAEASYNTTLRDIEEATLRAPFSGIVANVSMQPHSMANVSEPFCSVVNDAAMTVEFPILESELQLMKNGMTVEVEPFHGGTPHSGTVTEINPRVDENGQVLVKASVAGSAGLIDGMNVRVRSRQELPPRLSIPKSAVTLRTGRQVVFTYADGKAMWNYVTTGMENLDSYEITDGLEPGMTVIVSGNENLAHESPVKIKPASRK